MAHRSPPPVTRRDALCRIGSGFGMMAFAGSATLMYYTTEEGREGKEAFLEKRQPDFKKFPRYP